MLKLFVFISRFGFCVYLYASLCFKSLFRPFTLILFRAFVAERSTRAFHSFDRGFRERKKFWERLSRFSYSRSWTNPTPTQFFMSSVRYSPSLWMYAYMWIYLRVGKLFLFFFSQTSLHLLSISENYTTNLFFLFRSIHFQLLGIVSILLTYKP